MDDTRRDPAPSDEGADLFSPASRREFLKTTAAVGAAGASLLSLWPRDLMALGLQGATGPGLDEYIYGYSLVTMNHTKKVVTNVASVANLKAPVNQLVSAASYPDASFKDVTAPNADTLYSSAFLDLAKEPMVLSLPDMGDRYFLFPMLDGWTNVFQVPGKRTTGGKAATYAITGPKWKGTLPAGVTEYKAPTDMVWILGRTYCTGTPEDYKAVHALQAQYRLVPLSAYGKSYTPPVGKVDPKVDMKTAVRDQVTALSAKEYFRELADLLKDNPPAAADAPMVAKLAAIGVEAGKFDEKKFDKAVPAAAQAALPKQALGAIMGNMKSIAVPKNGWVAVVDNVGVYGTHYLDRATITAVGLGANRPQDAIYPTSETDPTGKPYSGANKYVLHFDKGLTPPADGFWSLTMYNAQFFFVDNPLNRYTLSPRNALKYNADGSLDLYLQADNPGKDKESNWLPAPKGQFILMMRLYWPKTTPPSIIDGTWSVPPVKQV